MVITLRAMIGPAWPNSTAPVGIAAVEYLAVGAGGRIGQATSLCAAHRWRAQNWWRSLERYAFPRIGRRPVSEVTAADVLEIVTPIWHVKAETAKAVRQRIRSVLDWAIAMGLRSDNPCDCRGSRSTRCLATG